MKHGECEEGCCGNINQSMRRDYGEEIEITVDSGAEESVCPQSWGEQFKVRKGSRDMSFRNASGGVMKHYGEREVKVIASF